MFLRKRINSDKFQKFCDAFSLKTSSTTKEVWRFLFSLSYFSELLIGNLVFNEIGGNWTQLSYGRTVSSLFRDVYLGCLA